MDGTTISVPIITAISCASSVAGVLIWVYTTFDRKDDALTRSKDMHDRLTSQDRMLREISENVAFIRGKMEK